MYIALSFHFKQFISTEDLSIFIDEWITTKFNLNYRNQYPVINAYSTYAASYDQFVDAFVGKHDDIYGSKSSEAKLRFQF